MSERTDNEFFNKDWFWRSIPDEVAGLGNKENKTCGHMNGENLN